MSADVDTIAENLSFNLFNVSFPFRRLIDHDPEDFDLTLFQRQQINIK